MTESITAIVKTDTEWKKVLSSEAYDVLRKHGTERPGTGEYDHFFEKGIYQCGACGLTLFGADQKFDSGTGWPSFFAPLLKNHVAEKVDNSFFSRRTEVHCARCEGHLGHVFPDGPKPTGLRYCINSVSLRFVPENSSKK